MRNLESTLAILEALNPEEKLPEPTREDLWDLVAVSASDDLLWEKTMLEFPAPGQPVAAMTDWLIVVLARGMKEKDQNLEIRLSLENDLEVILGDYREEIEQAQGLSSSLYVEKQAADPYLETYYPASVVGLIGSFVGLLVYIIVWVMQSEMRAEKK